MSTMAYYLFQIERNHKSSLKLIIFFVRLFDLFVGRFHSKLVVLFSISKETDYYCLSIAEKTVRKCK
jgi:hypothetical protein